MLKIRNRKRAASPDGHVCRMCGVAVVVGPDGRCRLGHMVGPPPQAASQPLPDEAPVTSAQGPRSESRAIEWQAPIEAAEATPVAGDGESSHHVAAPEATPEAVPTVEPEPFAHPYDEVLAWNNDPEPASAATWPADADTTPTDADHTEDEHAPAPHPEDVAPAGGDDLSSVLGELLAWDEPTPSALDVSADELPPAAGM